MQTLRAVFGVALLSFASAAWAGPINLGAFTFDSNLFGNSLTESDGGTFSASNWLNVANADPGNPGYLTGANFNTGIANIGFGGSAALSYTIGYGTGITNNAGADLGVVVARYSSDTFTMEVSTDGGGSFSAPVVVLDTSAVSSGVGTSYFYGGGGPFASTLWVHSINLDIFGIGAGTNVDAVRITMPTAGSANQLDLIRVAGFHGASVPEPGMVGLLSLGMLGLALRRRSRS